MSRRAPFRAALAAFVLGFGCTPAPDPAGGGIDADAGVILPSLWSPCDDAPRLVASVAPALAGQVLGVEVTAPWWAGSWSREVVPGVATGGPARASVDLALPREAFEALTCDGASCAGVLTVTLSASGESAALEVPVAVAMPPVLAEPPTLGGPTSGTMVLPPDASALQSGPELELQVVFEDALMGRGSVEFSHHDVWACPHGTLPPDAACALPPTGTGWDGAIVRVGVETASLAEVSCASAAPVAVVLAPAPLHACPYEPVVLVPAITWVGTPCG